MSRHLSWMVAVGVIGAWSAAVTQAVIDAPVQGVSQQAPADAAQPPLPPAASETVDFARDIAPILSKSCVRCHARGQSKGRFSLETREGLLKGGRTGPAIALGQSAESLLVQLVAGQDPDLIMPEKGSRLTPSEIGVLRAWIDQGAAWDARVSFARQPPRNLDPRLPTLPPAIADADLTHPVDRLLAAHQASAAAGAPRANERVLGRRLHLDLVGVLPSPEEIDAFVADTSPDKVGRLTAALLGDRTRYATHWLTFWNDLLRNDYRGPGYIDGGRRQITGWLYSALADNMPFDRFVSELVNPGPRSEGFSRGIIWRGVVNASQTPPMQAAQNISQVFMGVNLKCASCHDSFINDWQLADAYGLAGIYADAALEMVECDRPTGKTAPLKFLYPSLGTIDADADRGERVRQLAQVLVDKKNGRLSRTIVNRLWARLFGRGLVEPLDDMDQPSWHPDLLDWLAEDLVAHGYDLQHTLTRIVTSHAYQRVAADADTTVEGTEAFAGPLVRRMTAEQFVDGLGAVAGAWAGLPAGEFDANVAGAVGLPEGDASWIWEAVPSASATAPQTVYFRRILDVPTLPDTAHLLLAHTQPVTLSVNGTKVAEAGGALRPRVIDVRATLQPGRNVFAIAVKEAARTPDAMPSALLVQLFAHSGMPASRVESVLVSDAEWRWSAELADGWEQPAFTDRSWQPASVVANTAWLPSSFSEAMARTRAAIALSRDGRAALTAATPLTTALGRPGREQVVTVRSDAPTTLQALELTNGETFAALLRLGAERLRREPDASASSIATRVFRRALGRPPTPDEHRLALELLGTQPDVAHIEDLLWSIVMLPEFRLVH